MRELTPPTIRLPQNKCDTVIEWLLITLLIFAPLAFGAVDAWSEEIVILLSAAMATTLAAKLVIDRQTSFIWSWTYIPIVLFIGLVSLQLTPLPVGWIRVISPRTLAIQDDHPFVTITHRATSVLSLYPAETRHELRLLLCAATVFVVVVNTLRTSSQIIMLLIAVAAIGLVEAMLNILQYVSGTQKVLWIIPMANPYSGTFAGHAHFGQFINLCCGAMLALALVRMTELKAPDQRQSVDAAAMLFNRDYRAIWLLLICLALSLCGMCLSMTRGGMVAAMIAGAITVSITAWHGRWEGRGGFWIMGVLAGLLLLLLTGFENVYDRLATLQNIHKSIDVRPQIARDLIQVFKSFPLLGTGLGTHATVYPMYQTVLAPAMAYTADDEYLQMLEETGSLGLAVILCFILLITSAYFKVLFRRRKPIRAAGVGLGFGLIAILVQSVTDFGQQLPSLACLTSLFCGILVVLATRNSSALEDRAPRQATGPFGFLLRHAVLPLTLVMSVVILIPADRDRRAESYWNTALSLDQLARDSNWQAGNELYANLISATAKASQLKPDDVRYAYWLAVYRWQSVARPCFGTPDAALLTTRSQVAARVVHDLLASTTLCPTYAAPYAAAAQIELATLGLPAVALALMNKAMQLGHNDPAILIAAAEMDIRTGHISQSADLLRTCISADDRYADHAMDLLLAHNRLDLAVNLAGDNVRQLMYVFYHLPAPSVHPTAHIDQTLSRNTLINKLQALCEQPDADSGALALLGRISMARNDPGSASRYFERALQNNYSEVDWRLDLAHALVALGQTQAALSQVRACHRLAPERNDVRAYLEELSSQPRTTTVRSFG